MCRTGLWIGGYWCSVRRFVAVPPRKELGWVRMVGRAREESSQVRKDTLNSVMEAIGFDKQVEIRDLLREMRVDGLGVRVARNGESSRSKGKLVRVRRDNS